ncbi:MAG: HAMP domain-containing protein [Anaerolineae bacterium]|nr:HAMP domain-containing protein [Anaerolineae bacterium]
MTLRSKTFLIVGLTLVVLVSVLYGIATAILGSSNRDLERQYVTENVSRAVNSLQSNLDALSVFADDWAHWDDTVSFVTGDFPQYIDLNLGDTTFASANIDWMVFIDVDGNVVYNRYYDADDPDAASLPDGLMAHIAPDSGLLTHDEAESTITGFVTIPDGIMLLVASPITDSEITPPIYGTMIFGRMLCDEEVTSLEETTHLKISFTPLGPVTPTLTPAETTALDALEAGDAIFIAPNDATSISGFRLLDDAYGQPAVLLEMDQTRRIYLQGQTSLGYFLLSLLITGMVFTLITLGFLEKTILKPLSALSHGVETIQRTEDLATHVPVEGKDELSALSRGFNEMIDALAASRARLQKAHDELEQRVCERTTQLTESNALLEQEIEERKQAQTELAVARDQALDALSFKSQILANISHDARTPLNIISLHSELIQRGVYGPVNQRQNEKLDDVLISARQLLSFLDNLLGEAQMNRHQTTINAQPFNPIVTMREVFHSMQPLAARRGLELAFSVEDGAPDHVIGDAERLKQVVMNLIDNALKFSDQGVIDLRLLRSDRTHWAIAVSDQGIGMTQEAQEHIFDAFYQVDGSTTRRANRGVGLGLSIVRQLVTLMDGEILVTSKMGQGTTFTVYLPLGTSEDEEEPELVQHHHR